jgi:hypothetical protein
MNAPKLWPAEPLKVKRIVSSGRPSAPTSAGDFAADTMVPTTRLTLRIGTAPDLLALRSIAGLHRRAAS